LARVEIDEVYIRRGNSFIKIKNMEGEVYKRLGSKTLAMFVLQKIGILFIFVVAAVVFFFLAIIMPLDAGVSYTIMGWIVAVGVLVGGMIVLMAYITYVRYSITLTADNIKITRGFINEEEIGIPYRRIKDARIERNIADQLMGTSDILINTTSADDDGSHGGTSLLILPAIEKNLASHIQSEIVKRAEIEEIHIEPNAAG